MQTNNTARFALTFFFALTLAGCGGGGGSSGSAASGGGNVQTALVNTISVPIEQTRTTARMAAVATPNAGSVTQTSNTNAGVSQDQIDAVADYNNGRLQRIRITHTDGNNNAITIDTNDGVLVRDDAARGPSTRTYQYRGFGRRVNGGVALVDVYVGRYATSLSARDTDYLVGGVWLFVPDGAASTRDLEIGAFADGPNANLTPAAFLSSAPTAEYEGDATGLYLQREGGVSTGGQFVAEVELLFQGGTIRGDVDDVSIRDIYSDEYIPVAGMDLTLEAATVSASDGGFFTGDSSGTVGGRAYSGKWGGQFYGAQADAIGGTFGAITSGNADGFEQTFVGAFGLIRQETSMSGN